MDDFLKTNKRKSLSLLAVARSLLFWGAGAVAAFLLLSSAVRRADRTAFKEMLASLKSAKKGDKVYWGSSFGGAVKTQKTDGSSVDMIKGKPEDIAAADLTSKLGGAATVKGILTPEDARKRVSGLAIGPDEVGGERAALAGKGQDMGPTPAYATRAFFAGNGGASNIGDHLKAALEAVEVPAVAGRSVAPSPGRIPKARALAFRDQGKMRIENNFIEDINHPLTQLAKGVVVAQGARAANSYEAAAGSIDAVYDGLRPERSRLVKDAASLPRVDGASIPRIPGDAVVRLKN